MKYIETPRIKIIFCAALSLFASTLLKIYDEAVCLAPDFEQCYFQPYDLIGSTISIYD